MKKHGVLISFLILIIFSNQIYSQADNSLTAYQEELEIILEKCAEYCERLENVALYFVCKETMKEEIYKSNPRRSNLERNVYVYDYQLVKKGEKIDETRLLLRENGKRKNEKNAPIKTKRFYSKRPVFGPIGLMGKKWQDNYDYKIIEEETIKRREVFVIEAKPKKTIEGKPNYGKIWVDKKDFSVLRIEIEQTSLAGFESFEKKIILDRNVLPFITITHDYFIEKKGIRFPSKTVFDEKHERAGRRGIGIKVKERVSKTIIIYDKYKFFIVETEVKY